MHLKAQPKFSKNYVAIDVNIREMYDVIKKLLLTQKRTVENHVISLNSNSRSLESA
jgi:hypothetical protein